MPASLPPSLPAHVATGLLDREFEARKPAERMAVTEDRKVRSMCGVKLGWYPTYETRALRVPGIGIPLETKRLRNPSLVNFNPIETGVVAITVTNHAFASTLRMWRGFLFRRSPDDRRANTILSADPSSYR